MRLRLVGWPTKHTRWWRSDRRVSEGNGVQRFFLRTLLASCPWAGWYIRLTGDERARRAPAARFEQVRKAMLAGLDLSAATAPASGTADPKEEPPGWQQLPLL